MVSTTTQSAHTHFASPSLSPFSSSIHRQLSLLSLDLYLKPTYTTCYDPWRLEEAQVYTEASFMALIYRVTAFEE